MDKMMINNISLEKEILMNPSDVITFDNLRQKATMLGETSVKAKTVPFVSENAHGVIRKVKDYLEVAEIAAASGKSTLQLLHSD